MKRKAEVESGVLGRWLQHAFGAERNARHLRVNTQLRALTEAATHPACAPHTEGHSFIRRRPETALEIDPDASRFKRSWRHVMWLVTLLGLRCSLPWCGPPPEDGNSSNAREHVRATATSTQLTLMLDLYHHTEFFFAYKASQRSGGHFRVLAWHL